VFIKTFQQHLIFYPKLFGHGATSMYITYEGGAGERAKGKRASASIL
jgi:hypothetical protein